jgi:hypothetical protein
MKPEVVSDPAALDAYVSDSLKTILTGNPPGNILIVGHDLTVQAFLQKLIPGSTPVKIEGFGELFVVVKSDPKRPASLAY